MAEYMHLALICYWWWATCLHGPFAHRIRYKGKGYVEAEMAKCCVFHSYHTGFDSYKSLN